MAKTPHPCPENAYVDAALQALIVKQAAAGNGDAFAGGSVLRYANRRSLARLLCHYEIFRKVESLPGHIIEFGVFKGESLLRFAQFAEIFLPYDRSFDVIGFDSFSGFPSLHAHDGGTADGNDKRVGGWSAADYREELLELINVFDHDRFAPQKPRIRLVEGDIKETLPKFLAERPGLKTRLLHLDADLYEPTYLALRGLWDSLVVGGVVLLDEYGFDLFPGEARAVDDFFKEIGLSPQVRKFGFSDNPGGYIVKERY